MRIDSIYDHQKTPGIKFDKSVSMTQQQFKQETDINYIVGRYLQTGYINPMLVKQGIPQYGDLSEIQDYRATLEKIQEADDMFMQLSPKIRDRFNHDPLELLQFVADPKNLPEAVALGLAEPPAHLPLDVNVQSDTNNQGGSNK